MVLMSPEYRTCEGTKTFNIYSITSQSILLLSQGWWSSYRTVGYSWDSSFVPNTPWLYHHRQFVTASLLYLVCARCSWSSSTVFINFVTSFHHIFSSFHPIYKPFGTLHSCQQHKLSCLTAKKIGPMQGIFYHLSVIKIQTLNIFQIILLSLCLCLEFAL